MERLTRYLEELTVYMDNTKPMIMVALGAIVVTLVTHLIFRRYRIVKYLPGLIIIMGGFYNLYNVMDKLTASSSINDLTMFVILAVAGFISLFSALIIGIYDKPVKIKKKKREKEEGA